MLILLTLVHVGVCFILILVVLLQTGKGADLAGAFGMTGSQTAFGPRGATTFLSRMTTWSAIIFMFTSLSLYLLESRRAGSIVREPAAAEAPAPPTGSPGSAPSSGDASGTGAAPGEPTGTTPGSESSSPPQP
jgi:preprotein translocase subunit SecG